MKYRRTRLALATALAVLALSAPALAANVTVNESNVEGDVTVSESNNNRETVQAQSATIDQSNSQSQDVDQGGNTTATGGDQTNKAPAVANANVSPAVAAPVNVAAPVQTGPIEVLTHKSNRINQSQSNTDNSTYEANSSSTTVNRSSGVVVGNGEENVIVLDSSTRVSNRADLARASRTRFLPSTSPLVLLLDDVEAEAGFSAGVKGALPRTGPEHVAEVLGAGLALIAIGTVLCVFGRRRDPGFGTLQVA